MTITDEMVEKANAAHWGSENTITDIRIAMRAALEVVAPLLIAQGMRIAADMIDESDLAIAERIYDRAQELDPK